MEQVSHRRATVHEVMASTEKDRRRHQGWSAYQFYAWHRKDGGTRSYTRVRSRAQDAGLVPKSQARGIYRKRRHRPPWPGLMILHDGSTLYQETCPLIPIENWVTRKGRGRGRVEVSEGTQREGSRADDGSARRVDGRVGARVHRHRGALSAWRCETLRAAGERRDFGAMVGRGSAGRIAL